MITQVRKLQIKNSDANKSEPTFYAGSYKNLDY